jgi:DNA invertase Pin-like site-specific DNA recombinase
MEDSSRDTRLRVAAFERVRALCEIHDHLTAQQLGEGFYFDCQRYPLVNKLFLTIAAAFAEAERDRIRERIGQVKADQKARGRYLGGNVPFGFRLGESGELVPHEAEQDAIREIVGLRAQGRPLRAIAATISKAIPSRMKAWRAGVVTTR